MPTLRPGSFAIRQPNMFCDHCRARKERCARIMVSQPTEPAAFSGPDGFSALPAVLDTPRPSFYTPSR